jgi:hypothetical protein
VLQFDSAADAAVSISGEDVEAAPRGPADGLPRFELGEPGTGLEDMKVDICPALPPAVELEAPGVAASHGIDAPSLDRDEETPPSESLDFDSTARVSREEIESALREPAESPVAAAEPEPAAAVEAPAFEPPPNLEGAIASFNTRHVVLFRALRAEIGAGAANFVRSCRGALDNGFAELFATAELRADGSWDPEGLKRSVIEHRVANAADGFQELLDGEFQRLRVHLGDVRATTLADQLASIP